MTVIFDRITKSYGTFCLDIPRLQLNSGEVIKLYGNNGAGKTTMLRLIVDLVEADGGTITLDGINPATTDKWKKNVASYFDESFLIQYLKVKEYFDFLFNVYKKPGMKLDEIDEKYGDFFAATDYKNKKITDLSTGNKVKVGVLGTLMLDARLLILDEPMANLDPKSRINLVSLIKDYSTRKKCTVIVSSHDLDITNRIPGRSIILENGKLVYDDPDTVNNSDKITSYFYKQES